MDKAKSRSYAMMALTDICIMNVIFVGVGWNSLSLFAAPVTGEWGITRAAFMLTITLVATCNTIISMFLYGRLVEKIGMKKLIVVGGVLTAAGFAVFGLAQNIAMLYLTGILFGCGCALLNNNAVNAVVQMWFKKNQGTYMSIASTCGSVAGIVAATAVAAMIAGIGWRPALFAISALCLVGMIVCEILYKGDPDSLGATPVGIDEVSDADETGEKSTQVVSEGISYSGMLKTGKFWVLAIVMFIMGIVGYSLLANLPLLVTDYGYGNLSGTMLSVALLASAIFLIPSGRIMDKAGVAVFMAICYVFIVIAMVLMLMGNVSLALAYVISALVGAGYDMCMTGPGIITIEAFGNRDYAKKMGTISAFCYAGVALGPTIMSLFYDLGGSYTAAFIIFIALAIAAALIGFAVTRGRKKDSRANG